MNNLNGKRALVTGAARGVGAEVAVLLAEQGADVIINFRSKKPRAEAVAARVREAGRQAFLAQADITDEESVESMMREAGVAGDIHLLILNASGGLEKDKSAGYAMDLNLTAQVRMVRLALPLMPEGGRIIFVTSHLAHFYGQKVVYSAYEPIAASKKAGEDALRQYIPELAAKGIDLVIVSGDLIDGTITPKLMQRENPGIIEARRAQAGSLPTTIEFAQAIVNSATDVNLKSGDVVFVGSTN